jgi:hypothetical protein
LRRRFAPHPRRPHLSAVLARVIRPDANGESLGDDQALPRGATTLEVLVCLLRCPRVYRAPTRFDSSRERSTSSPRAAT